MASRSEKEAATRRVLLTGATGYVGGRLLRALEERGHQLRCLARKPEHLASRVASQTQVVAGDVVSGEVVHVDREGVLVDVGTKSEGLVPYHELSRRRDARGADAVSVGDKIDVYVLQADDDEQGHQRDESVPDQPVSSHLSTRLCHCAVCRALTASPDCTRRGSAWQGPSQDARDGRSGLGGLARRLWMEDAPLARQLPWLYAAHARSDHRGGHATRGVVLWESTQRSRQECRSYGVYRRGMSGRMRIAGEVGCGEERP